MSRSYEVCIGIGTVLMVIALIIGTVCLTTPGGQPKGWFSAAAFLWLGVVLCFIAEIEKEFNDD